MKVVFGRCSGDKNVITDVKNITFMHGILSFHTDDYTVAVETHTLDEDGFIITLEQED